MVGRRALFPESDAGTGAGVGLLDSSLCYGITGL